MKFRLSKELKMIIGLIAMVAIMIFSLLMLLNQEQQVAPEKSAAVTEIKAFPSAMGQGKLSKGGRGGRVIKVTNRNDSGSGSLRAAVEAEGPRIVIFNVGGEFDLNDSLIIENDNITIAGQTAPAPGVNIKGGDIRIKANHVIIRNVAVRPGDHRGREYDSVQLSEGSTHVMLDHLSLSFSIDEVFSTHFSGGNYLTLQNSIVAYPLHCSVHEKGCHGYNFLMTGDSKNLSLINNLAGFALDRNPRIKDQVTIEVIGNYFYDIRTKCAASQEPYSAFVDNVYENAYTCGQLCSYQGGKFYTSNNTCDGQIVDVDSEKKIGEFIFPLDKGVGLKGNELKTYLLENAGKIYPKRDGLDEQIIKNFKQGNEGTINKPNELNGGYDLIQPKQSARDYTDTDDDGIPNNWETGNGLNPNDKADANKTASNGYTNIENYINSLTDDDVDACKPQCDGKKCGDDGCGGTCGTCDAGKQCQAGSCIDKPLVPEDLPACLSLRADKSIVVTKDEKITITLRGKSPSDSSLSKIQLFASPGGQINKKPDDFICTGEDTTDEQYSYYCNGLDAWHSIGSVNNTEELIVETTFNDLVKLISDGEGKPYSGDINDLGIYITANIHGSAEKEVCSSNISRNSGKGAYSNDGKWDLECDGGCNLHIQFDPDPEKPPICNDQCDSDEDCPSNLSCSNGFCREEECLDEDDCECPPPRCNDECTDDNECPSNLICSNGNCRKEACEGEADCSCPNDPPPTCNSDCSDNTDCPANMVCSDGKCRENDCTENEECTCNENTSQPADLNKDDKVDMLDISLLLSIWGEDVGDGTSEDLNNDGKIDMLDVSAVLADWSQ